jgi:hypothetical protein
MTNQYILMRAVLVIVGWATMGYSQSDTLVLNQTEFRFPETYPGEVFLVKKVLISPNGSLNKSSGIEVSSNQAAAPSVKGRTPLTNRDLRGRSVRDGEYQKRMAQIQQKHGLPTMSASVQGSAKPFKVPTAYHMPEGSRFALTSNSPRIQTGNDLAAIENAEREAVRRR